MANADKGSDEYLEKAKNLKILSDAKANDKSRLDEYSEMVDNLEKLHKVKTATKSTNIPWKEITVGVFVLAEMLMVLKYEKFDVITSKAFGLVTKGRV
jgi:hypothetical protein